MMATGRKPCWWRKLIFLSAQKVHYCHRESSRLWPQQQIERHHYHHLSVTYSDITAGSIRESRGVYINSMKQQEVTMIYSKYVDMELWWSRGQPWYLHLLVFGSFIPARHPVVIATGAANECGFWVVISDQSPATAWGGKEKSRPF